MSDPLKMIIDHVSLSVSDMATAKVFYARLLAALGLEVVGEVKDEGAATPDAVGFGIAPKGQLWLYNDGRQTPPAHICFRADTRAQVRAFHAAGIAAGGTDNGPPGIRQIYHPSYYAAFVKDLEGHNIEAVCFELES